MIALPASPEERLYYLQNKSLLISMGTFLAMTLAGLLTGLHARQATFGDLNQGLVALSSLSAMTNAALALVVYPLLFTWLSRRLGALSDVGEIRAAAAVSLWPNIALLLMALVYPVPMSVSLIGGLISTVLFTSALGLVNGTTFWEALRHVLAVWLLMVVGLVLLSLLLGLLKGHHS